jgi:hypothetical protein
MELSLKRQWLTEQSTIGELFLGDAHQCFILEDKYRGDDPKDKVPGKTAIPCGRYEVVVTHSPRFNVDMPLLLNVPGYAGVRIHWGNDADDTEGCLLVGLDRGPDQVLRSRLAYAGVFQLIQGARARGELVHITITIEEEKPNA